MIASQTAFAQNNRKGRWCAMELDSIYCGDACQILQSWPAECIDLVFADPPFNIGYLYEGYHDDLPDEQYIEWTFRWMQAARRVLKPTGSIYVAIGDDFAADVRIIGRRLGLHLRNWIIWHYSFGQNMRTKFCRSHTHILYFTKHSRQFTFNAAALRYPGARHTEYQDLRASPTGRLPDDVWSEFPRVCGTFRERARIHGCQMPESLLMRIILASSNPGEVVLDPFVGSGTTVVAAKRLALPGHRHIASLCAVRAAAAGWRAERDPRTGTPGELAGAPRRSAGSTLSRNRRVPFEPAAQRSRAARNRRGTPGPLRGRLRGRRNSSAASAHGGRQTALAPAERYAVRPAQSC